MERGQGRGEGRGGGRGEEGRGGGMSAPPVSGLLVR